MLPAAGGVAFLRLCPAGLLRSCLSGRVRPVGPIPGTDPPAALRMAHSVRDRFRSGFGSKKAEGIPPPSAGPGLSFYPVIDIVMLYHAVCPVAGHDDMIENQNPDPVQQALKLNR